MVFFPQGTKRGVVDLLCYMYILPPHQLHAFKTIVVTLCDNEHSGDAIGSYV